MKPWPRLDYLITYISKRGYAFIVKSRYTCYNKAQLTTSGWDLATPRLTHFAQGIKLLFILTTTGL